MTPENSLARIGRYDGRLKAFVRVFDPPLAEAAAGGPTFAVKDLIDVAGEPTGGGARIPVEPSPTRHAVVVERLLRAGWRAVGKTHTVEFAYVDRQGGEHLPINDEEHIRNAMARFNQTDFQSDNAKQEAAKKIVNAAKRHDIEVDDDSAVAKAAH